MSRISCSIAPAAQPPLVLHVVNQFTTGGLENGVVNLINGTPPDRYRHAVLSLTPGTSFRARLRRDDVPIIGLNKKPGWDWASYRDVWRSLRSLRPSIVHTRNLPAMEYQIVAAAAGVVTRIHGEHGRDVYDLDGSNPKYQLLRKAVRPFITHYTAVSQDLATWLERDVGVPRKRIAQIYNGVDAVRFFPRKEASGPIGPEGFASTRTRIVGTVGRMQTVKDQVTLAKAFCRLIHDRPAWKDSVRLVMIGEGPLREEANRVCKQAALESLIWLPGERQDIPELLRQMDLFVLPSIAEGISNTILEAMASGLPVIATRVGGSSELVVDGVTGRLVAPANVAEMAEAIAAYLTSPEWIAAHGLAARARVEQRFSLDAMIRRYLAVYDSLLGKSVKACTTGQVA